MSHTLVVPGPAGLHLNQWVEDADANRRLIVEVIGDIDAATAPRLLSALTRIIGQGTSVCCDLSAVDFFGADGAHVLAVAHLRTAGAHGQFSVRGVLGLTARILESTGLDEILTIVD